jgi:hypothetical protein
MAKTRYLARLKTFTGMHGAGFEGFGGADRPFAFNCLGIPYYVKTPAISGNTLSDEFATRRENRGRSAAPHAGCRSCSTDPCARLIRGARESMAHRDPVFRFAMK